MHDRILRQLRERIRAKRYVMTIHAEEEMNDDELTIFDIEHAILTGAVIGKQRDSSTNEWKYLLRGCTLTSKDVIVVAKLSPIGKLVIITVYLP
ncbi:MAG: DUF4258 domain-containing protein [Chloroflexi bacterium]|nr:DUF4258 domain-containing protein [Chloroflexota bacterium]